MEEQQQLVQQSPRNWKLTAWLAGSTFLVVGIVLLLSQVNLPTSVFFSGLAAFALGWQGPIIMESILPQGSQLPRLPQRKHDESKGEIVSQSESKRAEIPSPTTTTVTLNDRGSHDELFSLGVVAETREPIQVHARRFLGKGIFVAGVQESGKTNLGALLAEQMGKCYIPSVIFDLKQEYASLVQVVPNGIHAGAHLGGSGCYDLSVENAAQFTADVMESGFQAVIDLQSYGTPDKMGMIIAAVVNGLMEWSKSQEDEDRTPCFIFLDEAHHFLPERVNYTQVSKEVSSILQQSFFQVVNMGRSYGFTMAFFTQRIANIAKWVIANCQVKVIMRHSLDTDLNRCEEEVKKDVATRDTIENMPQGHGIVIGLAEKQFIAHFALRQSYHASHTPDIGRAHKRYRDGGTKTAMLPEMEDLRVNSLQVASQLRLVEKPAVLTGQLSQHVLPAHLQETLDILAKGNIPLSDLAKRLGVSKTTAHRYVDDLKAHRKLGNVERSIES